MSGTRRRASTHPRSRRRGQVPHGRDRTRPPASRPSTANTNTVASTDTVDHAAKLGRERGSESPIPVSPAIATLAGRTAASTKPCTAMSPRAVPIRGAQYPVLDEPRPGRAGDRTDNNPIQAAHTTLAATTRTTSSAGRRRWPPMPSPDRPRGRPPTASTRRTCRRAGKNQQVGQHRTATTVTTAAST